MAAADAFLEAANGRSAGRMTGPTPRARSAALVGSSDTPYS